MIVGGFYRQILLDLAMAMKIPGDPALLDQVRSFKRTWQDQAFLHWLLQSTRGLYQGNYEIVSIAMNTVDATIDTLNWVRVVRKVLSIYKICPHKQKWRQNTSRPLCNSYITYRELPRI